MTIITPRPAQFSQTELEQSGIYIRSGGKVLTALVLTPMILGTTMI